MCDKCIHNNVCCDEGKNDNGMTFCANFMEERKGEWIYKKFDDETGISDSYFCSRCNFPLTGIYNNYCAVCGAIMKK